MRTQCQMNTLSNMDKLLIYLHIYLTSKSCRYLIFWLLFLTGAFLIPYFIMMVFQGLPLFIMEFAIGQRMKQSAVRCWNNVHPVFFGVGISCMLVSFTMCSYYIVVITWCLYYFFVSFTKNLPWQKQYCGKYKEYETSMKNYTWWKNQNQSIPFIHNNTQKMKWNIDNFPDCCVIDPPQYYWYHTALQVSPTLDDAGGVNWKIFGCLAAGWVVVYCCVLKGVKSSGKVSVCFQITANL